MQETENQRLLTPHTLGVKGCLLFNEYIWIIWVLPVSTTVSVITIDV